MWPLFEKHKIFTVTEIHSRYEILLENYSKVINIEALTIVDMIRKEILPATLTFMKELTDTIVAKKSIGFASNCEMEKGILTQISTLSNSLYNQIEKVDAMLRRVDEYTDVYDVAVFYNTQVIPAMEAARDFADELETLVGKKYWPIPTYVDLLYTV